MPATRGQARPEGRLIVIRPRTGLVAALDVGSSKICCFIAQTEADGRIRVIGAAHQASAGIRNGCVVDMQAAQRAVVETVGVAEERAGEQVQRVVVNLSAGEFRSSMCRIEVALDGHQIGDADLRRMRRQSLECLQPEDRAVLHCKPVGYDIDGYRGVRDPRGMFGELLGARYHQVTAAAATVRNLHNCIAHCHLELEDVVVSSYASGLACLVEDEREIGVTLLDMGGGTTTIASFVGGEMVFADSVPVGSNHITKDIACGLSTPLGDAERMKILCGDAGTSLCDDNELIDVPVVGEGEHQQANHVRRSILAGIVGPRIEEIFELVRERLELAHLDPTVSQRFVLTGGGAQLQGLQRFAEQVLCKQVRVGRPLRISGLPDANGGPAFAVCAGLLRHSLERHGDFPDDEIDHGRGRRLFGVRRWLKECF